MLACGPVGSVDTKELTMSEIKERMREGYKASFAGRRTTVSDERIAEFIERLAPPKISWKQMGKVERERHMARVVMPVMLLLFENFDSKEGMATDPFATPGGFGLFSRRNFGCLSCHGDNTTGSVSTSTFDFSSPTHLYPLKPDALPKVDDPDPKKARMMRFMTYVITPAMKILLGDEKTNCFTCHAVKH